MSNRVKCPRIIIAGTASGSGKTTVTCGVIQALVNRKKNVMSFKCGPDYIDPMFHRSVIGTKTSNIDLFLQTEETVQYLLGSQGSMADMSVIEGVMGYYDGMAMDSVQASTYDVACKTNTPAILIVNVSGMAISTVATLKGYVEFQPDSHIEGVILNHCSAYIYEPIKAVIEKEFNGAIKVLGYLPKQEKVTLKSRHLGLVTAEEVDGLKEQLQLLAEEVEKTVDLDGILDLANGAAEIAYKEFEIDTIRKPVRLAVARDKAFCFYYEDNLRLLENMGAELLYFSPMEDKQLPENIDGLYLGGGYPEVHAKQLAENSSMRQDILNQLQEGLPCYAECGGYMYLTKQIAEYDMVGYIDTTCYNTGRLVRFGYASLHANQDTILCKQGDEIRCHEFHVWDTEYTGDVFVSTKTDGRQWTGSYADDHVLAGYPHLNFYSNPEFAKHFLETCMKNQ